VLRDGDRPLFVGSNGSTTVRNACAEGHRVACFLFTCEVIQVFTIVFYVVSNVNKFEGRHE